VSRTIVRVTAALVFLFFGFVLIPVLQVATGDTTSPIWSILVIGGSAIMLLIFMPWGESWARRLRKRTEATQPDALVSIVQLIGATSGISVLIADDRGISISAKNELVLELKWEAIRGVQTLAASFAEERVVLELNGGAHVEFLPLRDNGTQRLTAARLDSFLSELRTHAYKPRAKT
jgi:hypothetical protein